MIIKDPSYNIEVPVITNGTSFKNDWKPRILFSNTVGISSGLVYGLDASYASDPSVHYWNTLSTKDTNLIDSSVNSLKWDNTNTYISRSFDTNNNLYNKYYKRDLETNLDNNAYLLTGSFALNANDLYDLDFRNTIFISSKIIGESYYKINSIKNYKAGELAEVELIKLNAPITPASNTISTNTLTFTYTGTSTSSSSSSSGGGSGVSAPASLSSLTDVTISNPLDEQILAWDETSGKWINSAFAGGTSKSYVDTSLGARDVSIAWLNKNKPSFDYVDSSLNKRDVSIAYLDVEKVDRGGDTMYGNLHMIDNARVQTDFIDSSTTYVSGFAGSGMRISNEDGNFDAVFDNLTVRKQMKVYEMQIGKISAINGGYIISAATGKVYDVSGNFLVFDENDGHNLIQFVVNDYIRAQEYDTTGTLYYLGQVVSGPYHNSTLGQACIEVSNINGTCWAGAELVHVGNSTDSTRQNIIYLTAKDDGNPYMDVLSGVNTDSFADRTKVRVGNLEGITDLDFSPDPLEGYGLYANGNVYLKGAIQIANQYPASTVAVTGDFADVSGATKPEDNATVGATWGSNIFNQPVKLADINSSEGSKLSSIEEGATVGATWTSNLFGIPNVLEPPSGAGLYLSSGYMGYYTGGDWQSYIDSSGNCAFIGVTTFGTSTVNNKAIALQGSYIWENAYNSDDSFIGINLIGYQGGTTKYRTTQIGDGKANALLEVNGQHNQVVVDAQMQIQKDCSILALLNLDHGVHASGIDWTFDTFFRLPQYTSTEINAGIGGAVGGTGMAGVMVWNTTTNRPNMWDGTRWVYIAVTTGN